MTDVGEGTETQTPNPTRAQIEYAEEFEALADAVEACTRSEDVAVLISTCRNQWMAANAAFADLNPPLKAGKSRVGEDPESRLAGRPNVNPIAVTVNRMREGHHADALSRLKEAAGFFSLAGGKLRVWDDREELLADFDAAIATLEVRPQARVHAWLAGQRNLQLDDGGRAIGEYIALSTRETAEGRAVLAIMRKAHTRLAASTHTLIEAAQYVGIADARATALAEAETRSPTLLDEAEPPPAPPHDPWPAFVRAIGTPREGDEKPAAEIIGVEVPDASDNADDESRATLLDQVLTRALAVVDDVRDSLARNLRPNRPRAPLPAPYTIDLTPPSVSAGDRAAPLNIKSYSGRTPEPPSVTKVGLLRCGLPAMAYQDGNLYQYRRTGTEDHAGRAAAIALNAITRANEVGIPVIVMPECFLPYDRVDEIADLADQAEIMLIAGVEHRPDPDGRAVNAAVTVVPGVSPVEQRKQRPSVYEVNRYRFAGDATLRVIERTPLGTVACVVCSDYLESDILWGLASHRPPIDTLVLPTRNPNPGVFSRLAAGDALRLHANVIIVNSEPGAEGPTPRQSSGDGTGVVWPHRDHAVLDATEIIQLGAEGWTGGEGPNLAVYDVTVGALSGRNKGRTEHGLAAVSHYLAGDLDAPADTTS